MKKIHLYYCIGLALFVTLLYQLFIQRTTNIPEQYMKTGQIVEKDIIAPFEFPLLKSSKVLKMEQEQIVKSIKPIYKLSDEILFKIIKDINDFFSPMFIFNENQDSLEFKNLLDKSGIKFSKKVFNYWRKKTYVKQTYEYLLNNLPTIYNTGVYVEPIKDSLQIVIGNTTHLISKQSLYSITQATEFLVSNAPNYIVKNMIEEYLPFVLKPNLVKDQEKYNEMVKQAVENLPKSIGTISKNEIIVRRNSRISEEDLDKIYSLVIALQDKNIKMNPWKTLISSLSMVFYYTFIGVLLIVFCFLYYPHLLEKKSYLLPILSGIALNVIMAIINNRLLNLQTLLIPYSLTIISSAILIDVHFAFFYNLLSIASIYPFVNWETFSPLVLMLSTLGVLLWMSRLYDKHQYISIWIYLVVTITGLTIIFMIYKFEPLMVILKNIGYALISSTLTVVLLPFLVPFLENKWNIASKQKLLELLDFNHPLLKRLATEAVGTYHHSLIVGNLTERAAESIGANPLLARVGSYYHDIGKIINPSIFTENNPDSTIYHDHQTPSDSATQIKNHVSAGITLAHKYKIPQPVIDIIEQHHGTSYIRYFLDKAEKSRLHFNLNEFRYLGPKPTSKEAALVMIADIIESTTKSWGELSSDDIKKIANDTILRLFIEGQFDECPLTLKDIITAKNSMLPILESVYRKRLQYPSTKELPDG